MKVSRAVLPGASNTLCLLHEALSGGAAHAMKSILQARASSGPVKKILRPAIVRAHVPRGMGGGSQLRAAAPPTPMHTPRTLRAG